MTKLTGRVVFPGDTGYDRARTDFNTRFSKYPYVIVYCREINDVMNAVRYARENRVPLRARSGGHSYEAFSILNNGIVIDVSGMNRVVFDGTGSAAVETGASLHQVYNTLWEYGVTVPGGTCPAVGVAGLTLGGGFGMLTRKLGLLCDSLLAVRMVNARGEAVCADRYINPDLFWACRGGGGGNFGIATSLIFKVHPVSNVAVYNITWSWPDARNVIKAWQEWAPFVDERLTSIMDVYTERDGRITSSGEFLGPEDELKVLLKPLTDTAEPVHIEVKTVPYIEAVKMFDAGSPKSQRTFWGEGGGAGPHMFKNTGGYVYNSLPDRAIDTLIRLMEVSPGRNNSIEFQSMGGAVSTIPSGATAYIHREAIYNMQYITSWNAGYEKESGIAWAEALREAMSGYTCGTYVNWPDTLIKDWPDAYYGANYKELTVVKAEYDPENIFRFEQSIRPA